MTTTQQITTNSVDWDRLGARLNEVLRQMVHGTPEQQYTGPNFYVEAVRRTLGYVAAGELTTSERTFPYDNLKHGFGLITAAQAKHETDGVAYFDRIGREKAEEQVKEMRAELARARREAGSDFAEYLRNRCNERTVPSRYRREGVNWAADMIDPAVPKDRFGGLLSDGGA